jgi:glycosyltransferase involved in cell wall biosynthesis
MANAMNGLGQDVRIMRLSGGDPQPRSTVVIHDHRGEGDTPRTIHTLNSHDVVIIQHEFGIYGGPDGREVVDFLAELTVPAITVLHTVVTTPSNNQRRVMQGLLNGSDAIVVLSHSASHALTRTYDVDRSRLHVIPHGSPDFGLPKRPYGLRLKPRILTWGLLSDGKGIEWGIMALSLLQDLDPLPDYYVVGQTHPKVVARDGLRYRHELERLATRLGVRDQVHFIDGYLDTQGLTRLINSADMYLLPYDTRDQVTSGVLVEAMVAGGPVVATRFPHAVELLSDGSGVLVQHESPASIAEGLRSIIQNPYAHRRMRDLTDRKGADFLWPSVGASMISLTHAVARKARYSASPARAERIPA